MYGLVVNALVIAFLPFILGKLVSVAKAMYNWKNHVVFYRKSSKGELLSLLLLAFVTLYFCYKCAWPEKSYFMITKTPTDAPSYMVRNRFRDYVSRMESSDVSFRQMMVSRRAIVGESTDPAVLGKFYSNDFDLEKSFIELEQMSHELRNNENRRRYLLYGIKWNSCSVCDSKSPWHYCLYIAPTIAKDYLLALLAIGLASKYEQKSKWRLVSAVVLVLVASYDIYELAFSESPIIQLYEPSGSENYLTRVEQLAMGRNLILLLMSVLALLVDFSAVQNPLLQRLRVTLKSLETSVAKLQTARLARTVVVWDDTLRKHYNEYQRKVEPGKQQIFNDPAYKKIQSEMAHKYNMEKVLDEADAALKVAFDAHFKNNSS